MSRPCGVYINKIVTRRITNSVTMVFNWDEEEGEAEAFIARDYTI